MRYFRLVLVIIAVLNPLIFAKNYTEMGKNQAKAEKNYGNAKIESVHEVEGFFSFRCNIKGWPAVIGEDILVQIDGIIPPKSAGADPEQNLFFTAQTRKYLSSLLSSSDKIELSNIRRGRTFSLIADVTADSNSLSDILIKEGLAQKGDPVKYAISRTKAKNSAEIPAKQTPGNLKQTYDKTYQTHGKLTITSNAAADITAQNSPAPAASEPKNQSLIASKNSKVFHKPDCRFAKSLDKKNSINFKTKQAAIETGRRPCKTCKP